MNPGPAARPLAGLGVLVTRPAHQAEPFCDLITAAGGTPIRFPVIAIEMPTNTVAAAAVIDTLDTFDLAIFISANAVEQGVAAVRARRDWPESLVIASIGEATAQALIERGLVSAVRPEQRFDSEALLEHPALCAVAGKRVVIFRGEGGRERLAETLRARGAEVVYAEVYRRTLPAVDSAPLRKRWHAGEVGVAVITSAEGLHNLHALLGPEGSALLSTTPLVVASDRVLQRAHDLGVGQAARVARSATDQGLFEAVVAWRQAETVGRDQK